MTKSFQINKQLGRVIAQGMNDIKVERKKNMTKRAESRATALEKAADEALSGRGVKFDAPVN